MAGLSWFAFDSANKHLAITLQYEHIAAFMQMAVDPNAVDNNRYYTVRAAAGLEPKIGWYLTLLFGVFVGAFLSPWLSRDRWNISVPPLWKWLLVTAGPGVSLRHSLVARSWSSAPSP